MKKSALQIARAAYLPKLPDAIKGGVRCTEGAATKSVANQKEIAELFPKLFIVMFTTEGQLIDIAEKGMRIIFMFFPIVGFQMVTTNFFQSVGMAGKSIFLSLSRQLIFLAPCLVILPLFFDVTGIWMSMAVSDALASIVAAFMLTNQIKHFKRAINGE